MQRPLSSKRLPYLTKDADSQAFYESFKNKREQIEEEIEKLRASLQASNQLAKSLHLEESQYFEKNRGGPNFQAVQIVDIYNRQRRNKSKIELVKKHIGILEAARKKFAGEETAMRDWDNMFKKLNIDVAAKRMAERRSQNDFESQTDRKLNDIKRGFNLLVTPAYPKRTFEPFENKYNIQELLDLKAQHSQSVRFKQLAAKSRVEDRLNPKQRGLLGSGEYSVHAMGTVGSLTDRSTKSRVQSSRPNKLQQTQNTTAQGQPSVQPQSQLASLKVAPQQPQAQQQPQKQQPVPQLATSQQPAGKPAPPVKPTPEPLPPNEF